MRTNRKIPLSQTARPIGKPKSTNRPPRAMAQRQDLKNTESRYYTYHTAYWISNADPRSSFQVLVCITSSGTSPCRLAFTLSAAAFLSCHLRRTLSLALLPGTSTAVYVTTPATHPAPITDPTPTATAPAQRPNGSATAIVAVRFAGLSVQPRSLHLRTTRHKPMW